MDFPTRPIRETMQTQLQNRVLFEQARSYAYRYLDQQGIRSVFPSAQAIAGLSHFDETLPESPQSACDTLAMLDEFGSPATVSQSSGRYFGFVNGSAVPIASAARWLAEIWNQNAALYVMSPIAAKLEQICEIWLRDLLQLPQQAAFGMVGGSSVANLCGLAAARYSILKKLNWDVNENGMCGAPKMRVLVNQQAHSSIFKALALLGFGKANLELLPADTQGRISDKHLPTLDSSCLLILQAGNVNTGAFDDFEKLCGLASQCGAWVHIDGAFGLWAGAATRTRHLTQGMQLAQSWSLDGHKTLNLPYDSGMIFCNDPKALTGAMHASAAYIPYGDQRDGMRYTPDMSRRARAVELWATLRFLGRSGVEELVDGLCERAQYFSQQISHAGFHVLNDVVFNQVLFACDTPSQTSAVLKIVQASGEAWCSGTEWQGEPAIRLSVCSWGTSFEDIDRTILAFRRANMF